MEKLKISLKQQKFLDDNDIPLSKVFNAKNYKSKAWKKIMLENELWIAIGVTPCKLKGHTMRTSGGACVECKPDSLRFLKRYYSHGYVYLAGSVKEMVFKVARILSNIGGAIVSCSPCWEILVFYFFTHNSAQNKNR